MISPALTDSTDLQSLLTSLEKPDASDALTTLPTEAPYFQTSVNNNGLGDILSGLPNQDDVLAFSEYFAATDTSSQDESRNTERASDESSFLEQIREGVEAIGSHRDNVAATKDFLRDFRRLVNAAQQLINNRAVLNSMAKLPEMTLEMSREFSERARVYIQQNTALTTALSRVMTVLNFTNIVTNTSAAYGEEGWVEAVNVLTRQSLVTIATITGAAIGATGGGTLGAALGSPGGPVAITTGTVGAIAGGVLVGDASRAGTEWFYDRFIQDWLRESYQLVDDYLNKPGSDEGSGTSDIATGGSGTGNLPDVDTLPEVTASTGTTESGGPRGLVLGDDRYSQVLKEILKRK